MAHQPPTTDQVQQQKYQDLELACQLWIAANDAKDHRIAELEQQVQRLRQKIARQARVAGNRSRGARVAALANR